MIDSTPAALGDGSVGDVFHGTPFLRAVAIVPRAEFNILPHTICARVRRMIAACVVRGNRGGLKTIGWLSQTQGRRSVRQRFRCCKERTC